MKEQRIQLKKKQIDSKNHRKLQKYSTNFNEIFSFFLKSYRKGILTFCGSNVEVDFDYNEGNSKFCFRKYDNGEYKFQSIKSKHPNILKSVIIGKKSWGLFLQQWSDGIVDWSFTEEEILQEFKDNNITIPEPLLKDFRNVILKKKIKRNDEYLKNWRL